MKKIRLPRSMTTGTQSPKAHQQDNEQYEKSARPCLHLKHMRGFLQCIGALRILNSWSPNGIHRPDFGLIATDKSQCNVIGMPVPESHSQTP